MIFMVLQLLVTVSIVLTASECVILPPVEEQSKHQVSYKIAKISPGLASYKGGSFSFKT